jgi:hypothetical protein
MVVRLNDGGGDLRGRGHGEGQLALATIVHGQALQQQRSETGSCSTTSGMEDHEALETSAVISQLADAVQHEVDDLLANGVVTAGIVVSGVLLARDDLLRVVQLSVGAGAHFIADTWLEVDQHSTRDVLASSSLREEGVERVIATADGLVRRHLSVRLDTVLEAVQLPAGIAGLDSGLADVDGKALTHS